MQSLYHNKEEDLLYIRPLLSENSGSEVNVIYVSFHTSFVVQRVLSECFIGYALKMA